MTVSPFHDPDPLPGLDALRRSFATVRAELLRLPAGAFQLAPDSLGERPAPYDERGWQWYALSGEGAPEAHRAACPGAVAACEAVPGLVGAGFSRLLPGTHLEPHRGELEGVLRCHLGLEVPGGDLGIRFGDEVRSWQEGELLVFDDTHEHEAWNRGDGARTVLLVTFRPTATDPRYPVHPTSTPPG
jgi:beta-hydroxylase